MNTKDIEEIVEHVAEVCDEVEFLRGVPVKLPAQTKALLRGRIREALTTLTQHHQAEVRREKQELINQLLKSLPLRSDWDDDEKVTFEKVVYAMRETLESYDFTPTKTDKQ